jgi:glyceraldehyde 3-phosphate dehydrogenase
MPWSEFSLGRSAVDSLIPKNTTAVDACEIILPNLKNKLSSFSYRTPLNTVTSGNLQAVVRKEVSENELYEALKNQFNDKKLFNFEEEDLVSIDYKGTDYSLSLYSKSIKLKKSLISLSFWYDNEWAYSQRIIDIANVL